MSGMVCWVVLTLAALASADILTKVGNEVTKDIVAVKKPVLETVVTVGNSQCDAVKKLFGLQYEQMNSKDREPDLEKLSLKYVTPSLNVSIKINDVARLLPKSPTFNEEQFVIFIHGFTDDPTQSSFANINSGFMSRGVYNILALDGSPLIRWLYLRSTTYVRFMGEKLGSILAQLVNDGLPPSNIHIIGHSLGAHISGFTGKRFTALTGEKVGRITGLDPAGPCFAQLDSSLRINSTDAVFVDAIHTNGGVAGMKEAVGQVDYYPNEGEQQPGCLLDTCSHARAWLYFGASLLDDTIFPAVSCSSWSMFKKGKCNSKDVSYMGIAARPGTKGTYYLQTTADWPYGRGMDGIVYENNEGFVSGHVLPPLKKPSIGFM
ncbi:hypothetical protein ACJJTC_013622 [Scirpophaga incertulas]